MEAVADSKGPSRTRSSSFKMADAKLLTRALAKGTELVQHSPGKMTGEGGANTDLSVIGTRLYSH